MDGDLFQSVLLGLLALGLIVQVALLATLGGIRKALEQRASQLPPESGGAARQSGHDQPAQEPGASEADAAPAAATSGGAQAATIRGVLEQHGLHDEPAATQAETTEPAAEEPARQEHVTDSVFAAHADDPQEEPFQRDGRWWFRRGSELLLYDEATGQWQPAPEGSGGAAAPDAGGAAAPGAGAGTTTHTEPAGTTTTQASPAVADAVATYWKCPTCGAVNGSTAATCRMCFAARP